MFLSCVHCNLICYHPHSATQNDKATTTKNFLGTVIHSTGRALASLIPEIIYVTEQWQLLTLNYWVCPSQRNAKGCSYYEPLIRRTRRMEWIVPLTIFFLVESGLEYCQGLVVHRHRSIIYTWLYRVIVYYWTDNFVRSRTVAPWRAVSSEHLLGIRLGSAVLFLSAAMFWSRGWCMSPSLEALWKKMKRWPSGTSSFIPENCLLSLYISAPKS